MKPLALAAVALFLLSGCDAGTVPPAPTAPPSTAPRTDAAPPDAAQPDPARPDAGAAPAGPRLDSAIARYEQYLHAIGAGDVATVCEIAGPAAKKAEAEGFGSCEQGISIMLSMYSPKEKTALRSATVDPAKVTVRGRTVQIPHAAHRVAIPMDSYSLPDSEMSYVDGQWFLTD
jgi:hypothetical protein